VKLEISERSQVDVFSYDIFVFNFRYSAILRRNIVTLYFAVDRQMYIVCRCMNELCCYELSVEG